jgi:hypothetical protein
MSPVIDGRLVCFSGHDLGFDASDPYADPDCAVCRRADEEEDVDLLRALGPFDDTNSPSYRSWRLAREMPRP